MRSVLADLAIEVEQPKSLNLFKKSAPMRIDMTGTLPTHCNERTARVYNLNDLLSIVLVTGPSKRADHT